MAKLDPLGNNVPAGRLHNNVFQLTWPCLPGINIADKTPSVLFESDTSFNVESCMQIYTLLTEYAKTIP